MQQAKVVYKSEFEVLAGNARAQAAVMVLPPGGSEGSPRNRHVGSDQWLYIASGKGTATVADQEYKLTRGTLLLIEHGETHEIRNDGNEPLKTLNFYSPPGFAEDGEPLPAGESS